MIRKRLGKKGIFLGKLSNFAKPSINYIETFIDLSMIENPDDYKK